MNREELVLDFLRKNKYTNDDNTATINVIVLAMGVDIIDYSQNTYIYNLEAYQLMQSLERQGKVINALLVPSNDLSYVLKAARWYIK